MPDKRKCIIVLGMHRSGTSAITGALSLMGVPLGTELIPPSSDNPKGFYENARIVGINEKLLNLLGSSYDDFLPFANGIPGNPQIEGLRDELSALLREEFDGSALFAMKDPRLCRLLPFWLDALARADIEPLVIIPLRHPMEIARSLIKRDLFPAEKPLLIWMTYITEAERASRGARRIFIRFDGFLNDPLNSLRQIADALGFVYPRPYGECESGIIGFLEHGMRHHLVEDANAMPVFFRSYYEFLLGLTGNPSLTPEETARCEEFAGGYSAALSMFVNTSDRMIKKVPLMAYKDRSDMGKLVREQYAELIALGLGDDPSEISRLAPLTGGLETLEFDISAISGLSALHFIPIRSKCALVFYGIEVTDEDGVHALEDLHSNAGIQKNGMQVFTCEPPDTPYIYFKTDRITRPSRVRVRLEILTLDGDIAQALNDLHSFPIEEFPDRAGAFEVPLIPAVVQLNAERRRIEYLEHLIWHRYLRFNETVCRHNETICEYNEIVARLNAELDHIYRSDGWKALLVYYRVRDRLFPAGSPIKKFLSKTLRLLIRKNK